MRRFIQTLILLLVCTQSYGQYLQVTHLTGTAVYGGVTVSLGVSGATGTGGGDCLITPVPYRTAGAPGSVPGTRTFKFSTPVYSVKLLCERIHEDEFVRISVNGTVYPLTAANMVSYTDCYGLYFVSLVGTDIYGPPAGHHSAGTVLITNCGGIDSVSVYCNGNYGGTTFYTWIDPTRCITATSNTPICAGDTLKLAAAGGDTTATYTWYGPGGYTATGRYPYIPNATAASAGVYTVVQAGGRAKDTGIATIIVNPTPIITAGGNSPACPSSTISLTSGPAVVGETFSWTGPNAFTSGLQNPSITPATISDTGFYTVIANLSGCKDTATVHIAMTYLTTPWDSSNAPLCSGDNLHLFATDSASGVTWSWVGPGGLGSTLPNPVFNSVTTANSGIFTVTATKGSCSLSDTIMVTVTGTPLVPSIVPKTRICSGDTIILQITPSTLTPGAVYHWTGPNGFTSTLTNPLIFNATTAASGLYSVYASNGGCVTTATYNNFVVDSTPEAPVASNNGPICSDSLLLLTATDNTAGVTYSWTGPASYTSTDQNPYIYNATTAMSGNYTVAATLGLCSSNSATIVLIRPTPSAGTIGSNGPICAGTLLTLSSSFAPFSGTFHWSGPNGFISLTQNPIIPNAPMADSGLYSVYEIVNGCTSDTLELNVVINPSPATPIATSNSPVCEGGTVLFSGTDATAGVAYVWAGPLGFSSTSQNPQIIGVTPAAAGVYSLTVTLGSCIAVSTASLSVTAAPTVTVSNNSPICTGDTLKLTAMSAPGNTFSWIGPYTPTPLLGPTPFRYPAIMEYSGVYQVTVVGPGGCSTTATDTVLIRQTPLAPWIQQMTICQYDYLPPLMAVDATNVLWFPTSAGGIGSPVPPVPSTAVPGLFFYYLNQTVDGCVSPIDSVLIAIHVKPDVTVTPADTSICPRDRVEYHATVNDAYATLHWYPSQYLSDSTSANPIATPVADIKYSVVATSIYNCTDTAVAYVNVAPAGVISITTHDSVLLYPGETFHIQPTTNCVTFSWFPAEGLSSVSLSDPVATPLVSSRYIVHGITERGCEATDSIDFYIQEETLYGIPNAFVPGNGVNNEFKLLQKGQARLSYFRIHNRWGELVFETKDIDEGWDGNYKGIPQPMDVYVYDINAVSQLTGNTIRKHGNVTLLR